MPSEGKSHPILSLVTSVFLLADLEVLLEDSSLVDMVVLVFHLADLQESLVDILEVILEVDL